MTKPIGTVPQLADYLLDGFWQYAGEIPHHWEITSLTYNISGLNSGEQLLAQSALNAWQEVTGLTFTQTVGSANITFIDTGSLTAFETDSYDSFGVMISATIDISTDWITTDGGAYDGKTGIDSYGYQTYLHEIGHALGLGHQGPYNGGASYSQNAIYANDTWQYSVMSYFSELHFSGSSYRYVVTPQIADIYAVDLLYGASSTTRAGNTTYGFHDTGGPIFDFTAYAQAPALTIYDAGGRDTLDCSGYSADQTIDLHPGAYSSVGGLVNNIGITTNTTIEIAVGGSGNDTLIANDMGCTLSGENGADTLLGGDGNDVLLGGAGADILNGGAGIDRAQYNDSSIGLTVDLQSPLNNTGIAAGDSYISIENLYGSQSDDALYGNNGANIIWGANGNDGLHGGGGNDVLLGGAGADMLDGGAGIDRVQYNDSPVGLTVDLQNPANNTGIAAGDSYISIENLYGSQFNDALYGNNGANIIWGANGNDGLHGGGGNDVLLGGAGADMLDGGAGIDRVQYNDSPVGLTVDLQNPANNTGIAAGDSYISIENLYGSQHDDNLHGDGGANTIWGANGSDVIDGGDGNDVLVGGAGADILNGGSGIDRAQYNDSPVGLTVDLQNSINNTGIAAGDSYISIENLYGSQYNDNLSGDSGANVIWGANGDDALHGGDGNDILFGGAGADVLDGGAGRDRAQYTDSPAGLTVDLQNPANNTGIAAGDSYFSIEDLCGSQHDDSLHGDGGANTIWGANGNDVIDGGGGNDRLIGGGGEDTFVFDTTLNATSNVDHVVDFAPGADIIQLDNSIFTALAGGLLDAADLVVGPAPQTASEYIIYNPTSGALSYDADGSGAVAAVQFATLDTGLAITHNDFIVV